MLSTDQVVRRNMTAVWIASTAWALNSRVTDLLDIHTIGTVIGITDSTRELPLFTSYARELFTKISQETQEDPADGWAPGPNHPKDPCPECENLSPANMSVATDPFLRNTAFSVYAATYSVAHALHKMLDCNVSSCVWGEDSKIYPWQVNLIGDVYRNIHKENKHKWNDQNLTSYLNLLLQLLKILKNTSFVLNGIRLVFDSRGNPDLGYNIVEWVWENGSLSFMEVGHFNRILSLNDSLLKWHTDNSEVLACFLNAHFNVLQYTTLYYDIFAPFYPEVQYIDVR